jgi:GT2 family glycosyltransferase
VVRLKTNLPEPVSLCLINYNGLAHLKEGFAALQTLDTRFDEILVIDNASTDGSLAYLNTCEQATVLALDSNTGPAGARNVGFLQAKHDIILFQDNDICLTEGVAETLYATLKQDEKILLAVPRVVYKSDPDTIQFEGADCHFLGLMSLRLVNTQLSQAPMITTQTSSLVTACLMIDRRRWHNERLFDERLIFNLEDHDLGVRANLLGFTIIAVPNAKVLHGNGTQGLSYRPGEEISATRMYCLIRNRWWIILRYFSLRTLIILGPLLLVFEVLQMIGLSLKGWGREWMRALVDTSNHLSTLYAQRKAYQKQRKCADRDILRSGNLPLSYAMSSSIVIRSGVKIFEAFMHSYWRLVKKLL